MEGFHPLLFGDCLTIEGGIEISALLHFPVIISSLRAAVAEGGGEGVVQISGYPDDAGALPVEIEIEFAPHGAELAGGLLNFRDLEVGPAGGLPFNESPHGADLGAQTAEGAVGVLEIVEELGGEDRLEAPLREVYGVESGDFVAGPDALGAEDAFVHVPDVVFVHILVFIEMGPFEMFGPDLVGRGELSQAAFEDVPAAALHAPGGIGEGLLLRQAGVVLPKGLRQAGLAADMLHVLPLGLLHVGKVLRSEVLPDDVVEEGLLRPAMGQIVIHGVCRPVAVSDGLNGDLRPGLLVAADEDPGKGGVVVGPDPHLPAVVELFRKAGEVDGLSHRGYDGIHFEGEGLPRGYGASSSRSVGLAQGHALAEEPFGFSVPLHGLGGRQKEELHPLLHGLLYFEVVGGHLLPGTAVEEGDLPGAEASGGAAGIHSGVSSAHYGHAVSDLHRGLRLHIVQEIDPSEHTREVLPRYPHGGGSPAPHGEDNAVEVPPEVIEGHVPAEGHPRPHFRAVGEKPVNLRLKNLLGETVVGDAVAHHPSQKLFPVEDHRGVPLQAEIIGRREPRRPSAHDGDGFSVPFDLGDEPHGPRPDPPVSYKTLDLLDGDGGIVNEVSPALFLAGGGADPADAGGEGDVMMEHVEGFAVLPLGGQVDVGLHVSRGRTCEGAGGAAVPHVVGEKKLEARSAGADCPVGIGPDDHPRGDGVGARPEEGPCPLHFHEADGAPSVEAEMGVVAEGGHLHSALGAEVEDLLPRISVDCFSVQSYLYVFYHRR